MAREYPISPPQHILDDPKRRREYIATHGRIFTAPTIYANTLDAKKENYSSSRRIKKAPKEYTE